MGPVICTLFENQYHYGLAALTNSLYNSGYRGVIYAGYRGSLPQWSSSATDTLCLNWKGAKSFQVAEGLQLHFLPVETDYHLTNYKPIFMLHLLGIMPAEKEGIIYFDPDIIVKCNWDFFERWITFGVALVHEIVSNDMPPSHPLRKEWENVISKCNKKTTRELYSYINGGFCGVSRKHIEFLEVWVQIFETGIKYFKLTPKQWKHSHDRTYIFYAQDQDALNITAMCSNSPISEMGPEAMDFNRGGWTMSHAVGFPKPWNKNFLTSALNGRSPTSAERAYWVNVKGPICLYSEMYVYLKKMSITLAAFIGRFYHRN